MTMIWSICLGSMSTAMSTTSTRMDMGTMSMSTVMSTGTITTSMPMAMGMYIGACGRYGRLLRRQI